MGPDALCNETSGDSHDLSESKTVAGTRQSKQCKTLRGSPWLLRGSPWPQRGPPAPCLFLAKIKERVGGGIPQKCNLPLKWSRLSKADKVTESNDSQKKQTPSSTNIFVRD